MIATLVGIVFVFLALQDGFETIVLPRRVTRAWRLARFYYRTTWPVWRGMCRMLPAGRRRENLLGVYGPLSLFGLFVGWVMLLISGFALMHWGLGTLPDERGRDLRECAYQSGETFFTLGYGDMTPVLLTGKFLAVVEAGTGFGFMAIIIGYLPVLYQAFSRREQKIALLDARAGSPPSVSELIRRSHHPEQSSELEQFLTQWEAWAAELLESHLSFPVLSYYRSQHDNQSWVAAVTVVLDACSVLVVTGDEGCKRRAELTFAMARHACVDLCLVYWLPPIECEVRLTMEEMDRLMLPGQGTSRLTMEQAQRLAAMQMLYEPFVAALAEFFCFRMPRFFPERTGADNWQTSPWTHRAPSITELAAGARPEADHFG